MPRRKKQSVPPSASDASRPRSTIAAKSRPTLLASLALTGGAEVNQPNFVTPIYQIVADDKLAERVRCARNSVWPGKL